MSFSLGSFYRLSYRHYITKNEVAQPIEFCGKYKTYLYLTMGIMVNRPFFLWRCGLVWGDCFDCVFPDCFVADASRNDGEANFSQ